MSTSGIDLIAIAFGTFNVLRLASYFPQIVAVARDRHGATAISFSCWSIWIGANATTALYAWVNLGDLPLTAIHAFNAACCMAVLLLAAYKRTATRCRPTAPHCHDALRPSLPASPRPRDVPRRQGRHRECRSDADQRHDADQGHDSHGEGDRYPEKDQDEQGDDARNPTRPRVSRMADGSETRPYGCRRRTSPEASP